MMNSFKKPHLDGTTRRSVGNEEQKMDFSDSQNDSEAEMGREYTSFSIYSSPSEIDETARMSDMRQYKRTESNILSKKHLFQHSVERVIRIRALIQKLKSFNSVLVKKTLIELVPLINNPETAIVLKAAGLCPVLLDLLKFDPLTHWSIVGLSLQAILSIVSVPECALTVLSLPTFAPTIESYVKSEKSLTQKIAARIIHCCFIQPIQHEWTVVHDDSMLGLLFKAMDLPYKDIHFKFLSLLEDLTYHCENTLQLCIFAEKYEMDFIHMIVDTILSESSGELRVLSLKIYLNALSAIQFDRRIEKAVILHALTVESYLIKNMQRSKIRKTSALASRGSKLSQLERLASKDVNQGIEMGQKMGRRSSQFRYNSDYNNELMEEAKKVGERLKRGSAFVGQVDVCTSEGILLQAEEMALAAEILWLIRSSVMFQRLVKHTKRTNLVEPTDNMAILMTAS